MSVHRRPRRWPFAALLCALTAAYGVSLLGVAITVGGAA